MFVAEATRITIYGQISLILLYLIVKLRYSNYVGGLTMSSPHRSVTAELLRRKLRDAIVRKRCVFFTVKQTEEILARFASSSALKEKNERMANKLRRHNHERSTRVIE